MSNTNPSKERKFFIGKSVVFKENSPDNYEEVTKRCPKIFSLTDKLAQLDIRNKRNFKSPLSKDSSWYFQNKTKLNNMKNHTTQNKFQSPEKRRRSKLKSCLDNVWHDKELFELCPTLDPTNKIENDTSISDTLVYKPPNKKTNNKRKMINFIENDDCDKEEIFCITPPKIKKGGQTETGDEAEKQDNSITSDDFLESTVIDVYQTVDKASKNNIELNLSNKSANNSCVNHLLQYNNSTPETSNDHSIAVTRDRSPQENTSNLSLDNSLKTASQKQPTEAAIQNTDLIFPTNIEPTSSDVNNNPVLDKSVVTPRFHIQVQKTQVVDILRDSTTENMVSQIDLPFERDANDTFNLPETLVPFLTSATALTLEDLEFCPSLLNVDLDVPVATSTPIVPFQKPKRKLTRLNASKQVAAITNIQQTSVTDSSQEDISSDYSPLVTTKKKKITSKTKKKNDNYLSYMGSFNIIDKKTKVSGNLKNNHKASDLFDLNYCYKESNYASGLQTLRKQMKATEKHKKLINKLRNSQYSTESPRNNSVRTSNGIKSKYMYMSSPKSVKKRASMKPKYIQMPTILKTLDTLARKNYVRNNEDMRDLRHNISVDDQEQPFYKESDQTVILDSINETITPVKSKYASVRSNKTLENSHDSISKYVSVRSNKTLENSHDSISKYASVRSNKTLEHSHDSISKYASVRSNKTLEKSHDTIRKNNATEKMTPIKILSKSFGNSSFPQADTSNYVTQIYTPILYLNNPDQYLKQPKPVASTSSYNEDVVNPVQHPNLISNEIYEYGFMNYGNTCYANATLQALLGLKNFVSDVELLADIHKQNNIEACMLSDFKDICVARKFGDIEQVNDAVKNLLQNFCHYIYPTFKQFEQQDAGEFLIKMINQFEKETNSELIPENFCFEYKEVFDCDKCKNNSYTEKVDVMLLVPVGYTRCTIQELLDGQRGTCPFCQEEKEDKPYQYVFKKLPRYLLINLNRYNTSNEDIATQKILTTFDISLSINVKYDISTGQNNSKNNFKEVKFDLTSVIQHTGKGAQSGHYTADVCHEVNGNPMWCYYNDKNPVKRSNLKKSGENCYILFYTQQKPEANSVAGSSPIIDNSPTSVAAPQLEKTPLSTTKHTHIVGYENTPLGSLCTTAVRNAINSPESSLTDYDISPKSNLPPRLSTEPEATPKLCSKTLSEIQNMSISPSLIISSEMECVPESDAKHTLLSDPTNDTSTNVPAPKDQQSPTSLHKDISNDKSEHTPESQNTSNCGPKTKI